MIFGLYTNGVSKEKRQKKRARAHQDLSQIRQLFEDGDRALIAADIAELRRIYAADYVQFDDAGAECKRPELIRRLTSGDLQFLSMRSIGRTIRLLQDDIGIVHGSEEDEIQQGKRRLRVNYIFMDVVRKRRGKWQIVASQLAKPNERKLVMIDA